MDFIEITEELRALPGEYIYHEPTRQVVLCGSFSRRNNQIRAFAHGRLFEDQIENFKKIKMTTKERRERSVRRGCQGCGKK